MKYSVKPTSKFRKDYKLAIKRGQNLVLLDNIIGKLADGIPLEPSNHDHELSGDYAGHRECHITPDWLLIYFIDDDVLVLSLTRTGSHSDLF
jgi:mRNA interferase YafQ